MRLRHTDRRIILKKRLLRQSFPANTRNLFVTKDDDGLLVISLNTAKETGLNNNGVRISRCLTTGRAFIPRKFTNKAFGKARENFQTESERSVLHIS